MKLIPWDSLPLETLGDGIARRYLTGEKITVAQFVLKKGAAVPEHSHESEQISYVLEGVLRFVVAGEPQMVRAGEALIIPSSIPHSAEAVEDCRALDIFSPIRQDWLTNDDAYLRGGVKK